VVRRGRGGGAARDGLASVARRSRVAARGALAHRALDTAVAERLEQRAARLAAARGAGAHQRRCGVGGVAGVAGVSRRAAACHLAGAGWAYAAAASRMSRNAMAATTPTSGATVKARQR